MDILWQELVKYLGGFAIFAGLLAWLIRSALIQFLSKDIEAYKIELAAESAKELEQLKHHLQIITKEHEVRFSALHEKRAVCLSELYLLLEEAFYRAELFDVFLRTSDFESLKAQAEEDFKTNSELSRYFKKNKLYLSKATADQMEKLISVIDGAASNYTGYHDEPEESREKVFEAMKVWNNESGKLLSVMKLIEDEFRTMLGSCAYT